jgi:hypothetical protein
VGSRYQEEPAFPSLVAIDGRTPRRNLKKLPEERMVEAAMFALASLPASLTTG